jgi:Capsule polysaccharide biosynthesis protein
MSERRVVIIETWNHTPHLETGLEIALRYAARKISVEYHYIGHLLDYVHALCGDQSKAEHAVKRIRKKTSLHKYIHFSIPTRLVCVDRIQLEDLSSLVQGTADVTEIKSLTYNSSPIGRYIFSTLVEVTRESNPSVQDHLELIGSMARAWLQSYLYTSYVCTKPGIGRIVLFNGRFNCVGGIREAAMAKGIPISYHERGGSLERFSCYPFRPHEQVRRQQHMLQRWNIAKILNIDKSNEIGASFYYRRLKGDGLSWFSFNISQSVPIETWLSRVNLEFDSFIVYFQSSDDEFAGIEDCRQTGGYSDQLVGVNDLALICQKLETRLCIRMHPNMKGKEVDIEPWRKLAQKYKIVLVEPGESVDSYSLVKCSKAVVVYHSTIGPESLFMEKKVICLGPSFYNLVINSIPIASCIDDLERFMVSYEREESLKTNEQAIAYGYASLMYGIPFRYVKPTDVFAADFLGLDLTGQPTLALPMVRINIIKQVMRRLIGALRGHRKSRL